ncbi:MAG: PrsW family glutamic-type intramembrane protease [Geitlerinemataceae cyanobacterium]
MIHYCGYLRSIGPAGTSSQWELPIDREVTLGRDPTVEIVLDSPIHGAVSRSHAIVRPLTVIPGSVPTWELCDLDSANGTYLNGRQLHGCQILQAGDTISLGQNGIQFRFEIRSVPSPTILHSPDVAPDPVTVTLTKLFPIVSTGDKLTRKAYLIPAIITVSLVAVMFATVGNPEIFNRAIGFYIAGMAYYFVYQLCGKRKPWWLLLLVGYATVLLLLSPVLPGFIHVFREILPGQFPAPGETLNLVELVIRMFFGAGLLEEILKALPLFVVYFIGRGLPSPWRDRIGIWEPLDGILLGSASAVGFTLLETLGQYVPNAIQNLGGEAGLQLLIARILGSVAGHMAYSGYFGYAIGLSVLIPSKRWRTLGVGLLTAAGLHALWNTAGFLDTGLLVAVGVISYAFLAAAILKARELSPNRSQNFATHLFERR